MEGGAECLHACSQSCSSRCGHAARGPSPAPDPARASPPRRPSRCWAPGSFARGAPTPHTPPLTWHPFQVLAALQAFSSSVRYASALAQPIARRVRRRVGPQRRRGLLNGATCAPARAQGHPSAQHRQTAPLPHREGQRQVRSPCWGRPGAAGTRRCSLARSALLCTHTLAHACTVRASLSQTRPRPS